MDSDTDSLADRMQIQMLTAIPQRIQIRILSLIPVTHQIRLEIECSRLHPDWVQTQDWELNSLLPRDSEFPQCSIQKPSQRSLIRKNPRSLL